MSFNSSDDLERLLAKCRAGDADAWQNLVDRFKSLVYSIPRRFGLTPDDASDVFQVTFQRLYTNLDRIETANGLPRWLAQTATHESLSKKRRVTDDPTVRGLTLDEVIATDERTAETEVLAAAESEALRRSVGELPARCRQLITMLYLDGEIPYLEVAEKMSMPVGSIGPTRARCLEKLRKILARNGFFD